MLVSVLSTVREPAPASPIPEVVLPLDSAATYLSSFLNFVYISEIYFTNSYSTPVNRPLQKGWHAAGLRNWALLCTVSTSQLYGWNIVSTRKTYIAPSAVQPGRTVQTRISTILTGLVSDEYQLDFLIQPTQTSCRFHRPGRYPYLLGLGHLDRIDFLLYLTYYRLKHS